MCDLKWGVLVVVLFGGCLLNIFLFNVICLLFRVGLILFIFILVLGLIFMVNCCNNVFWILIIFINVLMCFLVLLSCFCILVYLEVLDFFLLLGGLWVGFVYFVNLRRVINLKLWYLYFLEEKYVRSFIIINIENFFWLFIINLNEWI